MGCVRVLIIENRKKLNLPSKIIFFIKFERKGMKEEPEKDGLRKRKEEQRLAVAKVVAL